MGSVTLLLPSGGYSFVPVFDGLELQMVGEALQYSMVVCVDECNLRYVLL